MIHTLVVRYRHWRYKNLALLALSITTFVVLVNNPVIFSYINSLSQVNFFGAFIAGMLCASTFTVVPALVLLLNLGQNFNPIEVAILAGIGCTVGDLITMKIIKDQIFDELMPIFEHFRPKRLMYLFHTPFFAWLMPILGVVIIASPGPDEIGLTLLGVKALKQWQLISILLIVNTIGMLMFVGIIDVVKIIGS